MFYIIERKIYECTLYFIRNIERNRKDLIKYIDKNRKADWQFIYIELFSSVTKQYYRMILREKQVRVYLITRYRLRLSSNGLKLHKIF